LSQIQSSSKTYCLFVALSYTRAPRRPSVRPSVRHKPVPREEKMFIGSHDFHKLVVINFHTLGAMETRLETKVSKNCNSENFR